MAGMNHRRKEEDGGTVSDRSNGHSTPFILHPCICIQSSNTDSSLFHLFTTFGGSVSTTGGAADNYAAEDTILSPPMSSPYEKPSTKINPTMAIILVCLLSAFFMICVISTYFRHYTERQLRLAGSTLNLSETGSMRSVVHGLDPAVIATFPSFLYSGVKGIKIGQTVLECAVCLNEFQDHETLRLLPKCSHVFHKDCIDMWLASHVTCPVCRANLVLLPGELDHVTELLHVDPETDYASTEFLLPIEYKHKIPPSTEMPRSHSTGHSVITRPVENTERYTLRLPNEARGLFGNLVASLPTSPHMALPMESSQKMSLRSISVGSVRRLDYVHHEVSNHERRRGQTSRGGPSDSHIVEC
ncbi:unnamed protein product [Lactuca saligna]|uniref:RING-type E3 ubiquitin transferase n=1 Tax=Lactuca saligna TaxID=75948 RepID=A0AA36A239_LACSI|nr:unnamed protein product [Lactuca saligna]